MRCAFLPRRVLQNTGPTGEGTCSSWICLEGVVDVEGGEETAGASGIGAVGMTGDGERAGGGVEGAGRDGCDVEEGASADEGFTCGAGGAGLLEDGMHFIKKIYTS